MFILEPSLNFRTELVYYTWYIVLGFKARKARKGRPCLEVDVRISHQLFAHDVESAVTKKWPGDG